MSGTPDWVQSVYAVVRAIQPGAVLSYAEVARRAGRPGHARQVARVLAGAEGEDLPWHRVLRADGRIGLPPGSAAFDEQVARLRSEGVAVSEGRVRMPRTRPDLDALIWAPPGQRPRS
jgi:methylated-DNA-protein-cysteine methyltransferase related protein